MEKWFLSSKKPSWNWTDPPSKSLKKIETLGLRPLSSPFLDRFSTLGQPKSATARRSPSSWNPQGNKLRSARCGARFYQENGFLDRMADSKRSEEHPRDSALILRERQTCSPGWATEAQRRKNAKISPKGERSESIKGIHRNSLRVSDVAQKMDPYGIANN